MNNSRPFAKRIFFLGVLPAVCSTVLMICGFVWIQKNQLHDQQFHYLKLVENSLFTSLTNDTNTLSLTPLQPLLNIHPVTSLGIVDSTKTIVQELGLPIDKNALRLLGFATDKNTNISTDHDFIAAIPFSQNGEHYWLVVSIKQAAFRERIYQGYLLIGLVSMLSIGITVAFSQGLHRSIMTPLSNIIDELKITVNARQKNEITQSKNSPFSALTETLNELIALQHSAQDEMQHYVEQSTKELRETLETVEIQNIELDIARKNALQASRAKSEFLANTSHELRTPLNGILGFTSLLLRTGLTNQQKDYLSTIEQSAQGLLTVINDILDFSKLETGQLTLEYKPIFVREIIEEVFTVYAPQAHEKNIRLLSIVNHNVPRNLLGDPQRLKQVLTNLISNAIKFSARGNIVVRCNALGEMDSQVEIKFGVSDNGIGLSDDQQINLFTAFTKVDSSDSRIQGGTGLGLAIAKGLVDRMHGEIGVESEARIGSTFWFTVRLGVDKQRISQSPLMNSLYGVRALIYDANPTGRIEITHLLTSWGINFVEVSHFNNISNTLNLHSDQQIDLIILDSYTEETNFDKGTLLAGIRKINESFKKPIILLAPPAIQRVIQDEIIGLNTIIVPRPVVHNQLHQSICNLLSIAEPLKVLENRTNRAQPLNSEQPIRVLVVDDNPANRKLVCEFLRPLGTITTSAESGYEAIEFLKSQSFDIILMDVQMPGMDGMETTKLIRNNEHGSRTPIVALTAHAVAEQKTKLLLSGMDDFLSKPVSDEDLALILNRWVNKQNDNGMHSVDLIPPSVISNNTPNTSNVGAVFCWSESMKLAKDKPDLAAEMMNMLIASLDTTEQGIRTSLESKNLELLFEINHKFHGGCCYCGVPLLREASRKLEIALYHKDHSNFEQLTQDVLAEIRALKLWSEEHDIEALFLDLDD